MLLVVIIESVALALMLFAVVGAVRLYRPHRRVLPASLRRYERTRVIVQVTDPDVAGYAGLLEAALKDCIVLRASEMHVRNPDRSTPLDGELVLLRDSITSLQVVS